MLLLSRCPFALGVVDQVTAIYPFFSSLELNTVAFLQIDNVVLDLHCRRPIDNGRKLTFFFIHKMNNEFWMAVLAIFTNFQPHMFVNFIQQ